MARKKPAPKPMFELRHDFVASLENLCHQSLMMLEMVDTLIWHDTVESGIKELLVERSAALRAALLGKD